MSLSKAKANGSPRTGQGRSGHGWEQATVYDMADAIRDVLGLAPLYDKSVNYKTDSQRFHQNEQPLSEALGFSKPVSELGRASSNPFLASDDLPLNGFRQGWFGQMHTRKGRRL